MVLALSDISRFVARALIRFVALICVGFLLSCSIKTPPPVADRSYSPSTNASRHTVRAGDTLYSIAWQYGLSVKELINWNQLQKPYLIFRGESLRLKAPKIYELIPVRPSTPKAVQRKKLVSKPKTTSSRKPKSTAKQPSAAKKPVSAFNKSLIWSWPASGRVLQRYKANKAVHKGITIQGRNGDPVRAAAGGKIVYAGSGLSGLGRLIIIKHNDAYLSAYAHNRSLLAGEGQWVKGGDMIARMGKSSGNHNALYFEIRKKGRPVDPHRYLPKN